MKQYDENPVRRKIRNSKIQCDEKSRRLKFRMAKICTAKNLYGEKSYDENSYGEKSYGENSGHDLIVD